MDRRVIWGIVGLMTAAVVGLVWLQMDLIRTAIKENEDRFDKNVFNALSAVAGRMEYEEMNRQLYASVNGYATNYFRREVISKHRSFVFSDRPQINELIKESQLVQQFMENINTPCDCPACSAKANDPIERFFNYFQQDNKNQLPVEERVNFNTIQSTIAKELNNRGIDITFNFGIFSRATNNFVVTNDEVAVRTTSWPADEKPNTRQLFASRYRVNLFPGDAISPGLLMVYFPLRTSYVWSSLWLNFLGSIAFTGIILFCFAYTIQVIFRQKKLSEMKNDFINNMTHEFKTPIATISLASDSIINPTINGNPDKVSRFANIIKQENRRMNNQVEKVLQMAQMDRNTISLNLNEIDLHEIIKAAVENFSLQVEEKNGKVTYDLKAQNSILLGDSTHIANVIHNLLDNANKYSPLEPNIVVATQSVSGGIEVIFTDNGIGITREDRKYIFDKFYRVHTGNLHDIKGFGMGLSYVKAIVDAHGGKIEVKSELGKGSTFTVFLPFGNK